MMDLPLPEQPGNKEHPGGNGIQGRIRNGGDEHGDHPAAPVLFSTFPRLAVLRVNIFVLLISLNFGFRASPSVRATTQPGT